MLELLATLVLVGVVAAVATRAFRAQQRAVRTAVELVELRGQLRQAAHFLTIELRALAPANGDVHAWSSDGVTIRSFTGSSVVCRRVSDSTIVLPPVELNRGNVLTDWLVYPQPGDSLLVLDHGSAVHAGDDTWRRYEIGSITQVDGPSGCDESAGLTRAADAARPSFRIRTGNGAAISPTVLVGSSVRIFHSARYGLYRAGDGRWYLGASDCRARRVPPCGTIQPVSGPYRPQSSPEGSGLELVYLDSRGIRLDPARDDPGRIALIEVTARATIAPPRSGSGAGDQLGDSLRVSIAVRNRSDS